MLSSGKSNAVVGAIQNGVVALNERETKHKVKTCSGLGSQLHIIKDSLSLQGQIVQYAVLHTGDATRYWAAGSPPISALNFFGNSCALAVNSNVICV